MTEYGCPRTDVGTEAFEFGTLAMVAVLNQRPCACICRYLVTPNRRLSKKTLRTKYKYPLSALSHCQCWPVPLAHLTTPFDYAVNDNARCCAVVRLRRKMVPCTSKHNSHCCMYLSDTCTCHFSETETSLVVLLQGQLGISILYVYRHCPSYTPPG